MPTARIARLLKKYIESGELKDEHGNVLGKGYTAGVGMSIGTAFGRIAGTQAAGAALGRTRKETAHAGA